MRARRSAGVARSGYRQAWSFIVAKFMTDPVWWFFLIWLPDYFKKTRGLDIKHSWVHLVTIYAIITVLSIVGGWVTGTLIKRGLDRHPRPQDRHVRLRAAACCRSSGVTRSATGRRCC